MDVLAARLVVLMLIGALAVVPSALGQPPGNDDRANAELLATFPASARGTTVGATLERLDPQVSSCGRIDATVWYRIDAAPDGRIVVSLRASSPLAPVVRVYRRTGSAIQERACGTALAGGTATASFETVRGAGYFILVGRRPSAADGDFELGVQLFLPPDNDERAQAQPVARLPRTVRGSTLGATGGDVSGQPCGLASGTVWYRVGAPPSGRVVLRLTAAEDVDAAVAVYERRRSRLRFVGCVRADDDGRAVAAFDTQRPFMYLIAVGERRGSAPGAFVLQLGAAEPLERLVGRALPRGGASGSVDAITDVSDVWAIAMRRGTTYRLALRSPSCGTAVLRAPGVRRRDVSAALTLRCDDYATFTPGPQGGGRYTLEVMAGPGRSGRQQYAVHAAPAGADDVGIGRELRDRAPARGALGPRGVDVVDVYHFVIAYHSAVRLSLSRPARSSFEVTLATEDGRRLGGGASLRRSLREGRYVVAVRAAPGTVGGRYSLRLAVRTNTSTSITVDGRQRTHVAPGASVHVAFAISPLPAGGNVRLQIDRFDPFGGWHFHRMLTLPALGGGTAWRPPAEGTWRVRAAFRGTASASPSRSAYARIVVARTW